MNPFSKNLLNATPLTWQAYVWATVMLIFFGPYFLATSSNATIDDARIVVVLAQAVQGIFIFLLAKFVVRRRTIIQAPAVSIFSLVITGISLPLVMRFIANQFFAITNTHEWAGRLWQTAFAHAFWFLVIAIFVNETSKFRNSLSALESQIANERNLEIDALQKLEDIRKRVASQVEHAIGETLRQLAKQKNKKTQSKALLKLLDDVIRPLSRKISDQESLDKLWSEVQRPYAPERVGVVKVFRRVIEGTTFDWKFAPAIVALMTTYSKSWIAGSTISFAGVPFTLVIGIMGFGLANQILKTKLFSRLSSMRLVLVIVTPAIVAALDSWLFLLAVNKFSPLGFIIASVADFSFFVFIGATSATWSEQARVIENLKSSAAKLNWTTAKLRQTLWLDQRRLGNLVHGDIQGRILAAALSLKLDESSAETSRELTEKLLRECLVALRGVEKSQSLESFVEALKKVWKKSTNLEFEISQEVLEELEGDQGTEESIIEIVREAVNNAAKHSRAKNILITATIDNHHVSEGSLLKIEVVNDGQLANPNIEWEEGEGTRLFNQLALDWRLNFSPSEIRFEATIPLGNPLITR